MLTNTRTLRIDWGDCDPAGIVFYPRYFAWFDSCTTDLFERALGMTKYEFTKAYDVIGYPLVDAHARFIIALKFRDQITIESSIGALRRSSFTVNHQIRKDGALAVEGTETRVWAGRDPENPERIKARPLPREVTDRLQAS